MSHHRGAHSVGFKTLFQCVYNLKKMCFCVFKYVCSCASMCPPVCGSGGNRWEVCHVLVNKSVIVLCCPAWLTVSCAGSSSFPLNPGTLTRQLRMPAHKTHTLSNTHIHIESRTHPVMYTQTDSVMHQSVACNWIGTRSVIFLIWWPDAPQWRGICSLFPCHRAAQGSSLCETWLERFTYTQCPRLTAHTHT